MASDFYLGTYTKPGGSKGIYHYSFDTGTGKISGGDLAAEASNPSFLALHPGGHFLYAVNENSTGTVSAFSIGSDARLTLLNQQSTKGDGPCHVSVDKAGRNVLVANYGSGTVAVLPIREDGRLDAASGFDRLIGTGPNPDRQKAPYAHSMYADAAERFAYVCDLGTDWVHAYRFDSAKGAIAREERASVRMPPGSGPRHLVFHAQKDFVYVVNELKSTVEALARNPEDGTLKSLQTISTLPADFHGENTAAEIVIHPEGKYLYTSNRGRDSVAVFGISSDGRLSSIADTPTGGKGPRNIALDPSGQWLIAANEVTNDIFVFKIDQETGKLAPTGQRVVIAAPVCVLFH